MKSSNQYPEFEYDADQLSKFIAASDIVTILLKDGRIIHQTPKDLTAFVSWLSNNHIPDIKNGK